MGKDTGNTARAMASAPIVSPEQVAPETLEAEVLDTKHPLPTPVFSLVSNPKAYEDRNDKSKSNTRIAHVELTSGVFSFEASIYLETKVEQATDGRHERKTLRFSLPKGVKLRALIADDRQAEWKDGVIDAFLAWRKGQGGNVGHIRPAAGVRQIDNL